jgi:hypothetical protein
VEPRIEAFARCSEIYPFLAFGGSKFTLLQGNRAQVWRELRVPRIASCAISCHPVIYEKSIKSRLYRHPPDVSTDRMLVEPKHFLSPGRSLSYTGDTRSLSVRCRSVDSGLAGLPEMMVRHAGPRLIRRWQFSYLVEHLIVACEI